jgi:hypothetical protein
MDSTFTSLSVCAFDDPLRVVIELLSNKQPNKTTRAKQKPNSSQQPSREKDELIEQVKTSGVPYVSLNNIIKLPVSRAILNKVSEVLRRSRHWWLVRSPCTIQRRVNFLFPSWWMTRKSVIDINLNRI